MQDAATSAGAHLITGTAARRILTEDGAACGVLLEDGRTIRSRVVASSLDFVQTISMTVDRPDLTDAQRHELARFEQTRSHAIGSYAACMNASARYKSGAHNPDIDKCAQTFIGLDTTEEVLAREQELRAGQLPLPSGAIRVNSLWDPRQAPDGQHVAGADCPFPSGISASERSDIERAYPRSFVQTWADYAPNVAESILEQALEITELGSRKVLLRDGDAQYRGPVEGLYICGSSTHPGGGVHGACGANAFAVLMRDRALAHP